MGLIFLLTFLLMLFPSVVLGEDICGKYAAVTETEAVIEIDLKKDNTAELTTGYLPEEPDESFKPYIRYGRWSQKEGFIIIEVKNLGTLRYKIIQFLPCSEFGDEGGSFGLAPEHDMEEPFNRFGLWRIKDLLKHFNK